MTEPKKKHLSEETRKRIEKKHAESAQRALAAEVITLELLKRPTETATYSLIQAVVLADDQVKHAVAAGAITAGAKQLELDYAQAAARSIGHARNLAVLQVESEALEAAAIIHRLTGASVDLSVLRSLISESEYDAARAAAFAGSATTRWRNIQMAELAASKLSKEEPSAITRRLVAAKQEPLKIVKGHSEMLAFTTYGGQHRAAWDQIAQTATRPIAFKRPVDPVPYPLPPLESDPFGTGSEEGLPYGWGEAMMQIWSAILDRKTCSVCWGLDGNMIPVGKPWPGGITLPAHARCRCVPVTVFVPEAMSRKLPGIQIDYASLKADVQDYMRGSSLSIGRGARHAQDYISGALGTTSPYKLTTKLTERRTAYFPNRARPKAPPMAQQKR